ncbi:serine hydrolase domain-containing protein [Nocardia brasiliensis]|uniref:serine hydrolase domain-containing protein n=1 Tax=Nocardia brasiliensis TaxID=37326 RepID=UPI0024589821|nr:serine hydrolase domain-containing protein [Nocardia brasiliensis]
MRYSWLTAAVVAAVTISAFAGAGVAVAEPGPAPVGLQADLDLLIRAIGVPGAQLVVRGVGANAQIDSGVGDLATGAPFPDNAQVRIASNTKTFVATVVLQLAAEHRVELDAPIEQYLPGVVHGPGGDGHQITVRDLLQHTSGIPDYLAYLDLASVDRLQRPRPAAELIRLGLDQPAVFAPRTSSGYSNTDFLLAGALIERVTGVPVGVEVTRRIIIPLGLRDTYWPLFPLEHVIRAPHPRGYHAFDGALVDITDIDPGWGLADGAMVATGADLGRFFMALLSGELLPPAQLAEMQRTVPSGDPLRDADFGLGLFRRINACGIEIWSHGGAMNGFLVVNAATPARAVTLSMNLLPDPLTTVMYQAAMNSVLDAAFCAG